MKPGYLVRYSPFPHEELHKSGMIGLVVSEPYDTGPFFLGSDAKDEAHGIDVVWGSDRGRLYPAGIVCQEFVDELEVINESR